MAEVREIVYYPVNSDKKPYFSWYKKLDFQTRSRIRDRLGYIRLGLFGDCSPIVNSHGVWELKCTFGGGIRIYYGKADNITVVILWGGIKSTQSRDITKACEYWVNHNMEMSYVNKKRSDCQQAL